MPSSSGNSNNDSNNDSDNTEEEKLLTDNNIIIKSDGECSVCFKINDNYCVSHNNCKFIICGCCINNNNESNKNKCIYCKHIMKKINIEKI